MAPSLWLPKHCLPWAGRCARPVRGSQLHGTASSGGRCLPGPPDVQGPEPCSLPERPVPGTPSLTAAAPRHQAFLTSLGTLWSAHPVLEVVSVGALACAQVWYRGPGPPAPQLDSRAELPAAPAPAPGSGARDQGTPRPSPAGPVLPLRPCGVGRVEEA